MTGATEKPPLLSILLPAYRYPQGTSRLLAIFTAQHSAQIEIIVSDNSDDERVAEAVEPYLDRCANLRYRRNVPPTGACENWNGLLESARGDYVLLMHHDEFPVGEHFVELLLAEIARAPAPDVLVLECLLVDEASGRNRRTDPRWLREAIVRHAPGWLFRRNAIGAMGLLVVRRTLYPRFDPRLKILIDVDAYVQLLRVADRVVFVPAMVASIPAFGGSITASLRSQIPRLIAQELLLLATERPREPSLKWFAGRSLAARAFNAFEWTLWKSLRVLTRSWAWLTPSPVPEPRMRQWLARGAEDVDHRPRGGCSVT